MNLIEKIKEYGVFGSVNLAARRIVLLLSNYLKALLISFSPKKITEYELKEILTVSLQNTLTTNGINNSPLKAAVNFFIPIALALCGCCRCIYYHCNYSTKAMFTNG